MFLKKGLMSNNNSDSLPQINPLHAFPHSEKKGGNRCCKTIGFGRVLLGLDWDNGKENGNYYSRVWGLG